MNSKILILSHKKLTNELHKVIHQLPTHTSEIIIKDIGFGGLKNFLTQKLASVQPSMIITGGAHWEMLKNSNMPLSIPTVPIPITRYDLLSAVVEAKTINSKIAIIYYGDQLAGLEKELLNFFAEIQFFKYSSNKEVFKICNQLKKQGFGVVIGTGFVCEVSESFGFSNVFLHSQDSIKAVIEHVLRIEEARTQMLEVANRWTMELMKKPVVMNNAYVVEPLYPAYTIETISELGRRIINESLHQTIEALPHFTIAKFRLIQPLPLRDWAAKARNVNVQITFYSTDQYTYALLRGDHQQFIKSINYYLNKIKKCGIAHIQTGEIDPNSIETALQESELAYNLAKVGEIEALNATNPYSVLLDLHKANTLPVIQLLKPLLSQRNKDRLIETLELLLDHGLSITTVSNYLGISRQTVYTLMKRIEKLVGLLSDANNRFLLSLELRIYRLQCAFEKTTTTHAIQNQLQQKTSP
ncbi:MAG TPA: PrpR N-terminal domain-containing protein [Ureibacillus sp.]|nr:PrpR N-terminal domain-containing protein [Ureibacillus sp.]